MSLDALRGFDMFWITGGATIFRAFTARSENGLLRALRLQFEHVQWEGFRFYDLIFPLFLFMIGVAIPFALSKRLARGDSRRRIYGHILLRVVVLIFFGMLINGNLLSYKPGQFTISYSVLQMLALGYLVAGVLWLNLSLRWQVVVTVGLLSGYWALQTFVPVPGYGPGVYQEHALFGDWFNDQILGSWQTKWRLGWILGVMTHGATAMLGVLAGEILRAPWRERGKVAALVALGLGCLAIGWLWSYQFPIIKARWTSTFALWAGGWSYLLLALFYLVIDVWHLRRWAFPFVVIGANSIFAYMACGLCNGAFKTVADRFLGGLAPYTGQWQEGISWTGTFLVLWLLLYYMYRNKTFLRV
jgi:predicted acyltransferase